MGEQPETTSRIDVREVKKAILEQIEEDKEFRYTMMGMPGFKEILDRITRLEEDFKKLAERKQKLEERHQKLEERMTRDGDRLASQS